MESQIHHFSGWYQYTNQGNKCWILFWNAIKETQCSLTSLRDIKRLLWIDLFKSKPAVNGLRKSLIVERRKKKYFFIEEIANTNRYVIVIKKLDIKCGHRIVACRFKDYFRVERTKILMTGKTPSRIAENVTESNLEMKNRFQALWNGKKPRKALKRKDGTKI